MKAIVAVLLSLALLSQPLSAQWIAVLSGSVATGGASKLYDSYGTSSGDWDFSSGGSSGAVSSYGGQEVFQFSATTTVTKIFAKLKFSGSPVGRTVFCAIYTETNGNHDIATGSPVAVSSGVAQGSWSAYTSVEFDFSGASGFTSGTNYNVVFYSAQNASGGGFNLSYVHPSSTITGRLSLWNTSGVDQYPGTFNGYQIEIQIWGTTP